MDVSVSGKSAEKIETFSVGFNNVSVCFYFLFHSVYSSRLDRRIAMHQRVWAVGEEVNTTRTWNQIDVFVLFWFQFGIDVVFVSFRMKPNDVDLIFVVVCY